MMLLCFGCPPHPEWSIFIELGYSLEEGSSFEQLTFKEGIALPAVGEYLLAAIKLAWYAPQRKSYLSDTMTSQKAALQANAAFFVYSVAA